MPGSAVSSLLYLQNVAYIHRCEDLAGLVLDDPRFIKWSGSSKPEQHHYGDGGLVIHTAEVVKLAAQNNELLDAKIPEDKLFLSCLYHDVGKMWDYKHGWKETVKVVKLGKSGEMIFEQVPDYDTWSGTDHKRKIHHISRSGLTWHANATKMGWTEKDIDEVLHAILAHHGLREWGSPVMPSTKLAWMLHLCDGISARMNDADKWDHTTK